MRVVYTGPSRERWLPDVRAVVERGVPVDVPAELARGLLEQPGWERPPRRRSNGGRKQTRREP